LYVALTAPLSPAFAEAASRGQAPGEWGKKVYFLGNIPELQIPIVTYGQSLR
jgi:hypothetical protein